MPRYAQAFLAAAIVASTVGSWIALSPPNPREESKSEIPDPTLIPVRVFFFILTAASALSTLHTCSLIYFFPNVPRFIYRYGEENQLNTHLITWSVATSIPLTLILFVGVPLRLVSYASLGKSFTFALKAPDRLITDGIYHYLQHPSYPGTIILLFCNPILLLRIDGSVCCWIPPPRYQTAKKIWWWCVAPAWSSFLIWTLWRRVTQEESMLLATFGAEWERWHATTARFVPGIF